MNNLMTTGELRARERVLLGKRRRLERELASDRNVLGSLVKIILEIANLYMRAGRADDARQNLDDALDHLGGKIEERDGKPGQGLELQEENLRLRVNVLEEYGVLLRRQGDFEGASKCYKEALDIANKFDFSGAKRENIDEIDKIEVIQEKDDENLTIQMEDLLGRLWGNLGMVLRKMKENDDARNALSKAISLRRALARRTGETAHLEDLGNVLFTFGNFHRDNRSLDPAIEAHRESLEIREKLEREHPGTRRNNIAESMNALGILLNEKESYDEARNFFEGALSIYEDALKDGDSSVKAEIAMLCNNLGHLHAKQGNVGDAERFFARGHELYRDLARKDPLKYGGLLKVSMTNYQLCLNKAGKREEALLLWNDTLEFLKEITRQAKNLEPGMKATIDRVEAKLKERKKRTGRTASPGKKKKAPGRNEPCPCGSGKKYKKCCLEKDRKSKGGAKH